jgi:phospholipid N-methyltransferase
LDTTIALLSALRPLTPLRLFADDRLRAAGGQPDDIRMSQRIAVPAVPLASRRLKSAAARRGAGGPPRPPVAPSSSRLKFFSAFLREPLKVGAFWPSSRELAEQIVEGCDLYSRETVVELGPGTGAFTCLILDRLPRKSRFFALEINRRHVTELRRRFPRLQVYADCAGNLPDYLRLHSASKADCIISGLAWGNMLPSTQNRILDGVLRSLAPGGLFTTFAYVHASWFPTSLRFRKRLFRQFSRIEITPIVWRNLPPAFIYRCWRDD